MSDSDDTDELLLIPPDFFLVESDSENLISTTSNNGPYYSVVDSLITQVNNLELRLSSIESASEVSLSVSLDDNNQDRYMHKNRKYSSFDDLVKGSNPPYFWSTQSTPLKQKDKYFDLEEYINPRRVKTENVLPSHKKSPIKYFHLSPRSSKSREELKKEANPKVFSEIDNFIASVKNIRKFNESKNYVEDSASLLAIKDVAKVTKDIEECSLLNKNISKPQVSRNLFPSNDSNYYEKVRSWQSYTEKFLQENDSQSPQRLEEPQKPFPETINEEDERSVLSGSTQVTALHTSDPKKFSNSTKTFTDTTQTSSAEKRKAGQVQYKQLPDNINQTHSNPYGDGSKLDSSQVPKPSSCLAFLSLHDLWNKTMENFSEGDAFLLKKLEEEKLMRKHCEEVIRQQQKDLLDLQERIAVAVQIDQAKDEAIEGFYTEWYTMQSKIKNMEEQAQTLKKRLEFVEEDKKVKILESEQKLKSLESETSKALNLAHNSQEMSASLEKENSELRSKLQMAEEKCRNIEMYFAAEKKKNQQLLDLLNHKDIELNENKNCLVTAKNEVMQSKKMVEACQEELTSLKAKLAELQCQLEDEKEWNRDFELQKKKLQSEIDSHLKVEHNLHEEIKRLKEANDKAKIDLRNFYQDQVEIVVRDKLKEFETQLEKAEQKLQYELKAQEKSFAKAAATHIYQITEKHNMEVQLLEERHQEEVRLYKLQLSQARQQLEATKAKLQRQQERIVEQLYKAMEAQWLEALKVIGSGNSPILQNDRTLDQLNFLKNTSYNSFERILSQNVDQVLSNDNFVTNEEGAGENVYMRDENIPQETPLSSRTQKSKQEIENELQKYIQALLHKSPRAVGEDQIGKVQDKGKNSGSGMWQSQGPYEQNQDPNMYKGQRPMSQREGKQMKPPWK